MKKLIILFSFILGVAVSTNAQTTPAEFKFDKESYDFGKIPLGKPVSVEFKFTNIGDTPLILSKVETTCGCTVPEYTHTPVKKGETGTIKVTYNPAGSPLPFSKSITLNSNAKTSIKVLYIKGETVAGTSR
ncbi:DUF1573 domain-containing protein [Pedobacter nutrimenti]|jgi:hypothetical protein|uniref:Uncharacterized protein DUF1573 n=1 Tax=Pedobacter nutrimenti TaxID=1241337 RepID=A0A318UDE0_9SPHI|nr:DUF1573 domain-containing protein [Pedobacter nutrimenti]PYF68394.1 uncharacterized protein DUF1573 [Pedobacter nutrimenti]|eukprot:gene9424-11031_t